MNIDTRFTSTFHSVYDVPEPLRFALLENVGSQESIRLLVHTPAVSMTDVRSPVTVLAITDNGWLVASEAKDGNVGVEKCNFSDTLFLELTSILLWGQLRIDFASVSTSFSAIIQLRTENEKRYREAIDLVLDGIDQTRARAGEAELDHDAVAMIQEWPIRFRNEAQRYLPRGQHLLAATQWPAIIGGFRRELAPAAALLITERELVLIAEEKTPSWFDGGDFPKFGEIIKYFPLVRLADFHVSHQERFSILALEVHARHGGEKLEIIFPSDHEKGVSEVMEQARTTVT